MICEWDVITHLLRFLSAPGNIEDTFTNLKQGEATQAMYKVYRQRIPFFAANRPFTPDIEASRDFIMQF